MNYSNQLTVKNKPLLQALQINNEKKQEIKKFRGENIAVKPQQKIMSDDEN